MALGNDPGNGGGNSRGGGSAPGGLGSGGNRGGGYGLTDMARDAVNLGVSVATGNLIGAGAYATHRGLDAMDNLSNTRDNAFTRANANPARGINTNAPSVDNSANVSASEKGGASFIDSIANITGQFIQAGATAAAPYLQYRAIKQGEKSTALNAQFLADNQRDLRSVQPGNLLPIGNPNLRYEIPAPTASPVIVETQSESSIMPLLLTAALGYVAIKGV